MKSVSFWTISLSSLIAPFRAQEPGRPTNSSARQLISDVLKEILMTCHAAFASPFFKFAPRPFLNLQFTSHLPKLLLSIRLTSAGYPISFHKGSFFVSCISSVTLLFNHTGS